MSSYVKPFNMDLGLMQPLHTSVLSDNRPSSMYIAVKHHALKCTFYSLELSVIQPGTPAKGLGKQRPP